MLIGQFRHKSKILQKCVEFDASQSMILLKIGRDKLRDKREKFVDLAEARVNRALKDIQLIGNLSNRSAYDYTDEDVRKIFRALQKELESAKAKFGGDGGSKDTGFKLGD